MRIDETIRIVWNNRSLVSGDQKLWTAELGTFELTGGRFRDEIVSTHERLMNTMSLRIDELGRGCFPPDVHIDVTQIANEHAARAASLERALDAVNLRPLTDWSVVRSALASLDRELSRK